MQIGPTYIASVSGGPLRQGEILSNVSQHLIVPNSADITQPVDVTVRVHPIAIILTQDCDLSQDFNARASVDAKAWNQFLPSILLGEVGVAEDLRRDRTVIPSTELWKQANQNKLERYQFLREVPADLDQEATGLAALIIDFKKIFTLPSEVLYAQLDSSAKRRARLASPYVEHLSVRHAYFSARIALPLDHNSLIA